MTSLESLVKLSQQVDRGFARHHCREWGVEAWFIELSKQVGELAKYLMVCERYYSANRERLAAYAVNHETIGNELADIFHSVAMIADHYGLDLGQAILYARHEELEHLRQLDSENPND